MNSLSIIIPFILVGGVGALVLFIVAVIQEGKSERHGGFRQAFFTVVSLVMLTITVGASVALLGIGLKQYVFRSANTYQQRYSTPPGLYLPSQGAVALPLDKVGGTSSVAPAPGSTSTVVYQCSKDCQFTAADKDAVTQWVTTYKQWQADQGFSQQTRQSLASALGFLIVGLPLFYIFFRLMRRTRKDNSAEKPGPLWSLYFYGVAFAGLVMAVVASGIVINDGLQVWLKTSPNSNIISQPAPDLTMFDYGVKSLVACKDKCGFTAEQVTLANQWLKDNAELVAAQQSNKGQFSSDLASAIPFILIGLPLFWFHFSIVRKETSVKTPPATL